MTPRNYGKLRRIMELWQVYKLLRFIKDRKNGGSDMAQLEVLNAYSAKSGLTGDRVYELLDACKDKNLIWLVGNMQVTLRHDARELLDGQVWFFSLGIVNAELRLFKPILGFLAGFITWVALVVLGKWLLALLVWVIKLLGGIRI